MARYRDKAKAKGKPRLFTYNHKEHWSLRHNRRHELALRTQNRLYRWCLKRFLKLRIHNDGHHWIIKSPDDEPEKHLAQWWPRTAKLIIRCDFKNGIHCHDVYQVIEEISRVLEGQS